MTVFANGREISAEAQGCKVIAAFPDTCFTPPENPATPPGVPVPYPDFGVDSDLTSGSGSVKIGNKPISQENSSHYKKCTGDEAGAAAKKGLITSQNRGKIYAQAWSADVKVESKGVARLGDMATSNHASNTGDTPTMVIVGTPGPPPPPPHNKCQLTTYNPNDCPEGETPHHLIGDAQFKPPGDGAPYYNGCQNLTHASGLCICLQGMVKTSTIPDSEIEGLGLDPNRTAGGSQMRVSGMGDRRQNQAFMNATRQNTGRTASMFPGWAGASPYDMTLGEHGRFHEQYDNIVGAIGAGNTPENTITLDQSADVAADLCCRMHGCDPEDIKKQITDHYGNMGIPPETRLRSGIENSRNPATQPAPGTPMGIVP
ncbi:DUF4150 domain-containing protein [Mesorhizobium sp. WSM2239]|uniref:DUF4150 domain-containing protein n=2 Tax=unclassified Mesorhizobium TaxID=325217 RepID=A0AAU8DI84_9HYPH